MRTRLSGTMLGAGVEEGGGAQQAGQVTIQYALERAKGADAVLRDVRAGQGLGEVGGGRTLLCASCGHTIASKDQAAEINGSHRHTFANPHGLVFRIACFSSAPGCTAVGGEHVDFAWFAGYAWSVEQCARCGVHLGWRFSSGVHVFHGLVYDRLVESGERGPGGHTQ